MQKRLIFPLLIIPQRTLRGHRICSIAAFEAYHVNWDSVYALYKPQVATVKTDKDLFDVLVAMNRPLKDLHFLITTPNAHFYAYAEPRPTLSKLAIR